MKKISLFAISLAAVAMTACTDYREQINEAHDEYVSEQINNLYNYTIPDIDLSQNVDTSIDSSGCTCTIVENDLVQGGIYDYAKNGAGIVDWIVSGCRDGFSVLSVDLKQEVAQNNLAGASRWGVVNTAPQVMLSSDPVTSVFVGVDLSIYNINTLVAARKVECPDVYVVGSMESPSSSSFVENPSSSSSVVCGDLWCGRDGSDVVRTGYEDGNSVGVWYDYTDVEDYGDSKFTYPANVKPNIYDYIFGNLINTYHGIKGSVLLGGGAEYPYAGLAFNLFGENNATDGIDITDWGGICLVYQSSIGLSIELGAQDEKHMTEYNNYKATVPKSVTVVAMDFPWAKFKQEVGWGVAVEQVAVLSRVAAVRLKFSGTAGTTGDFFIQSIGRLGTCGSY